MNNSFKCSWCNSPDHLWRPNRREFLYVGLVGSLGLTLGNCFKLQARTTAGPTALKEGPAKSVINIYLPGGMAAQESFDPKLLAPIEYRGPFMFIDLARLWASAFIGLFRCLSRNDAIEQETTEGTECF